MYLSALGGFLTALASVPASAAEIDAVFLDSRRGISTTPEPS